MIGPSDAPDPQPSQRLRTDAESGDSKGHLASEVVPVAELLGRLRTRIGSADRYEIRGEIGRGGMGCVFSAHDRELRRRVAMKVLMQDEDGPDAESAANRKSEQLARFLEEAQVTAQLDHPGIVPVHELGIDGDGSVFFTMRLVHGLNLARVFERVHADEDGWSCTRALGVLLKVCEAMAFAHDKGVVHRDLKPANVMVGRFGETYVMDWGLARILSCADVHDLRLCDASASTQSAVQTVRSTGGVQPPDSPLVTMDGRVVGTPSYMAPEQAAGHVAEISPRSDVYSLGAILYHLLTGTIPYVPINVPVTPRTILARVLDGPPRLVQELEPTAPDVLVAICDKAMARDPLARYATALELAQDIRAFLEHRPVTAQPPSLPHTFRLWMERNRAIAAITAAAMVLVAALAVWFVVHLAQSRRETERLADMMAARALLEEAKEDLAPLLAASREPTERWLHRAAALLDRLPNYQAELSLPGEPSPPLTRAELQTIVGSFERLRDEYTRVQRTLSEGRELPARSAVAARKIPWSDVFADLDRQAVFACLPHREQQELVPLGKNPAGFWQFWCVASGACPVMRGDGVPACPTADTGMVLVLLPGGDLEFGSHESDAEVNEAPVRVVLPPFLLATHEATQGQWLRVMATNPSRRCAGMHKDDIDYSAAHPVESVTWFEARTFARRLGLRLPEAHELEYAGRADHQESVRFAGLAAEQMEGFENLRDATLMQVFHESKASTVDWSDGYPEHAPVGSFEANPFGLFDVAGNVSEWSQTLYGRELSATGGPDPRAAPEAEQLRCIRGGSWGARLSSLRASYSIFNRPGYVAHWLGVRLARDWQ